MPLQRRRDVFDHPDWLFELKYDGFRALAVIQPGRTQLISRNGHPFTSYADLANAIATDLNVTGRTVLDGEIVCLDRRGRPQFKDLLFRRGQPCFYVFDLLMLDGRDQRNERLFDSQAGIATASVARTRNIGAQICRPRGRFGQDVVRARVRARPGGHRREAEVSAVHQQS